MRKELQKGGTSRRTRSGLLRGRGNVKGHDPKDWFGGVDKEVSGEGKGKSQMGELRERVKKIVKSICKTSQKNRAKGSKRVGAGLRGVASVMT